MKYRFTSMQLLAAGFALLILLGGTLLYLPVSTHEQIPFVDAVFTAASATCVTGLVVYDTFSQFTLFGQIVILLLIQIGGLGFMTVAILFSMLVGRRIGLRERSMLMEAMGAWKVGGIVRLIKRALIGTAIFELSGMLLLSLRFCPRFGFSTGLWYALFHSVSAFCNAGFDLMGRIEPYNSLMAFRGDAIVNFTIMTLIVCGGLGFFLWSDVIDKKWRFSRYQLHTKIMLTVTPLLILVGAGIFFALEYRGVLADLPLGEKLLASLFQSVSPRTAGFNTLDLTALHGGSRMLTIILMFIGAGSGSTGGGVKVTTFFVLIMSVVAKVRNYDSIAAFNRRFEDEALKSASTGVTMYLSIAIAGAFILCAQGYSMDESLFEAFSAMGTVGLSLGVTPTLPLLSRIVIILLMYGGRVGSLSVAMAMVRRKEHARVKNTVEKVIVG